MHVDVFFGHGFLQELCTCSLFITCFVFKLKYIFSILLNGGNTYFSNPKCSLFDWYCSRC